MSIKRIESSYAYFAGKDISSTQMAVLQALACCANETHNELCFPSNATLAKMTHLTDPAVSKARKALRDMKIISWTNYKLENGKLSSNYYKFHFPFMRLEKEKEPYEKMLESGTPTPNDVGEGGQTSPKVPPTTLGGTPNHVGEDTQPHWEGSPTTLGETPNDVTSNTESKSEINLKSKSESNSNPPPAFDFDVSSLFHCTNHKGPRDPRMEKEEINQAFSNPNMTPIGLAMLICGVTDEENKRTFTHYSIQFEKLLGENGAKTMRQVVEGAWEYIKSNTPGKIRNRAGVLTEYFKAALAALRSGHGIPKELMPSS